MTPQQRLLAAASQLCADELEVLTLVAERLLTGQRCYGLLRLASDQRDFHREALEECADGLVYAAAGIVRERMRQRRSDVDERPPCLYRRPLFGGRPR